MFTRILVPLDGSAPAAEALPVAARIARASRGSIHLLTVVSSPIDYGGGYDLDPLLSEQQIETETTVATDYLRTIVALPILDGIQVTTEVAPGLPAQYILAAARSGEVDLTVLSSHGRMGFTRWVLGSVAHTLAHESTVPTLILHENETASLLAHPDAARPLRVLVPLDGSPLAETALEPAAHLVASLAAQSELHLTQVVKPLQTSAEEGFESSLNAEGRGTCQDLPDAGDGALAGDGEGTGNLHQLVCRTRNRRCKRLAEPDGARRTRAGNRR